MEKGFFVVCKNCRKEYYYEISGDVWAGGKDREIAICPYCKADGPSEFISGFIYSYKLDENRKPIR